MNTGLLWQIAEPKKEKYFNMIVIVAVAVLLLALFIMNAYCIYKIKDSPHMSNEK
jgi:hypothetical protein